MHAHVRVRNHFILSVLFWRMWLVNTRLFYSLSRGMWLTYVSGMMLIVPWWSWWGLLLKVQDTFPWLILINCFLIMADRVLFFQFFKNQFLCILFTLLSTFVSKIILSLAERSSLWQNCRARGISSSMSLLMEEKTEAHLFGTHWHR